MPITHKNRNGDLYYLKRKLSKTGKPRYFFSKKVDGDLPTKIPEGFEVYENPNAQVFLRRKLQSKIKSDEIALCKNLLPQICDINTRSLIVDYKQIEIIIYYSDQIADIPNPSEKNNLLKAKHEEVANVLFKHATYLPYFKFKLVDEEKRLFIAERFCFLGGIDDWIRIGTINSLENLIRKHGMNLGKETFYELL